MWVHEIGKLVSERHFLELIAIAATTSSLRTMRSSDRFKCSNNMH